MATRLPVANVQDQLNPAHRGAGCCHAPFSNIKSLEVIKARQNLTVEQGTAVYNSELALEARLIAGISADDPNAKRAYELLKKSRRN
jgi:hypothetical protein